MHNFISCNQTYKIKLLLAIFHSNNPSKDDKQKRKKKERETEIRQGKKQNTQAGELSF